MMVAEHGRIKKCEPDDQSHAGTGGHGGVPPPEIIRRIEGRQEVEHQSHALGSDQKVDHGCNDHQEQQQKQLFGYFSQAPSCDAERGPTTGQSPGLVYGGLEPVAHQITEVMSATWTSARVYFARG